MLLTMDEAIIIQEMAQNKKKQDLEKMRFSLFVISKIMGAKFNKPSELFEFTWERPNIDHDKLLELGKKFFKFD